MKKIILILIFATIQSACGKKDNNQSVTEVKVDDPLTTRQIDIDTFVAVYDLIRMDTEDCGASLQIIKICNGLQVRSNNLVNQSFCNVNKGEVKTRDNRSSTTVTLENNILRSVVLIFDERSTPPGNVKQTLINSLTTETNGNLLKLSDLKTGKSSCLYQKR